MPRLTLLFCLFGLAWSQVFAALDAEGIVGGELIDVRESKYQIGVYVSEQFVCGGCIINKKYVMTAARPFTDEINEIDTNKKYTVVTGTADLNTVTDNDHILVDTIYLHNRYLPSTLEMNIAIFKLSKKLKLGPAFPIDKVNLPESGVGYTGKEAIVTGFGAQNVRIVPNEYGEPTEREGSSDNKLRRATVVVHSYKKCWDLGYSLTRDSGNPLVYDRKVIGIVSKKTFGCDDLDEKPAVYTRVSEVLPWITDVMAGKKKGVKVNSWWSKLVG